MSLSKISTISPGLAPEYNPSSTYDVGEYVLYLNSYWRCVRAITEAEPWTQEHWEMDYCFPKKLTQLTRLESGYRLGPSNGENASKILASEAEAEALRSDKANKSEMSVTPGTGDDADKTTIQLKTGTSATVLTTHQDISGKADLVDGVVPASQLPSYVDDVVEYDAKSVADVTTVFRSDRPYPEGALVKHGSPAQAYVFTQVHPAGDWTGEDVRDAELFPEPGEKSKIYLALNTDTQYRWSGSTYIEIAKYVAPYDGTPEMAGTASPGTADSYSRGDHVHPTDTSRASVADTTLTERGFSVWAWEGTPPTYEGKETVLRLEDYPFALDDIGKCWVAFTVDGEQCSASGEPGTRDDDNTLSTVTININGGYHTATRTALQGYVLGSQTDKPLASEAEAEALRTEVAGKANLVNGTVPTNELPDGTASGKGIVQLDASLATSGKAADAKATGDALADKRDKTDLKVYEQADYWEGIPTSGSTVTLTLESSASNSKTYSNGSEVGCYKMLVRDYRSAGGYFQVYLSKLSVVMGRETWTKVIVTPEESSSEITEVSTTISSPSYTFRHHAETVPEQDNFLATTKDMNSLLDEKLDKSGGTMTGAISFDDSMPSGGPCSVYYNTDQWHLKDHMGTEIVTPKYAGGTVALTSTLPYTLVTKTISNNAVALDDRASNYTATSASSVSVTFPAQIDGKMRDFVWVLEVTGTSAPAVTYASYCAIMTDSSTSLVPEVGMNAYSFTEVSKNRFVASRMKVTTAEENVPGSAADLAAAMQAAGYTQQQTANGSAMAEALGLSSSATFEQCARKFIYG